MTENINEKLDKLPDIAVIDPREFRKFLTKHSPDYYKELHRRHFNEVPQEFWKKLFELAGNDWFDFWSLFANPILYTPCGSAMLNLLYWKKLNEAMRGWQNFNDNLRVMMGWDTPMGHTVGIDVAATLNEIVMETPLLKLRHYAPKKRTVETPIFIVYSTKVGDDGTGIFGAFTDLELVNLKEFLKNNNGVFPGYMMNFFFDAVRPKKKAEQMYSTYVKGKGWKLDPLLF